MTFSGHHLAAAALTGSDVQSVQQGELDELEREEFFRLKKVQAKKKRDAAITDALVNLLTWNSS